MNLFMICLMRIYRKRKTPLRLYIRYCIEEIYTDISYILIEREKTKYENII